MQRLHAARATTVGNRRRQLADEFDEWTREQGLVPRPLFSIDLGEVGELTAAEVERLDPGLAEWMLSQYLDGIDR